MAKNLPVPPDLEHLIEKRERENDRRQPANPKDSASSANKPQPGSSTDRRRKRRRKSDS
jgi:hypothetical protein